LKGKLKGKDKFETAENYTIIGIIVGVLVLSSGFFLSIINPKGLAAILLMFGSSLAFISTIALVLVWFVRELFQ
jgi:vacuolar-type H+-ATPase subunit I/STV1